MKLYLYFPSWKHDKLFLLFIFLPYYFYTPFKRPCLILICHFCSGVEWNSTRILYIYNSVHAHIYVPNNLYNRWKCMIIYIKWIFKYHKEYILIVLLPVLVSSSSTSYKLYIFLLFQKYDTASFLGFSVWLVTFICKINVRIRLNI